MGSFQRALLKASVEEKFMSSSLSSLWRKNNTVPVRPVDAPSKGVEIE